MKTFQTTTILLLLGSSHAFMPTAPSFGVQTLRMSEPEAAPTEAAPTEAAAPATPAAVVEKRIPYVRKAIGNLTKENFASTLADIEPYLTNEAGISFHTKSLKRIARLGKSLGAQVPENYGKEAKATAKRRGKQDAFVKAKIEEVAAAAVEAAEAKAAEEAEAKEAAEAAAKEAEDAAAAAAAAPAEESSEGAEEEAPAAE